jgi:hypothetical protein
MKKHLVTKRPIKRVFSSATYKWIANGSMQEKKNTMFVIHATLESMVKE